MPDALPTPDRSAAVADSIDAAATIDPVSLRIQWDRLISIMDEADLALLRSAFSTIVSDSRDYAVILLDRHGNGIAQPGVCVPSFTHSLPRAVRAMLAMYPPETLQPGDVLFSNDPWLCHGHLPDFFIAMPIFAEGRIAAYYAAAAHISDIGGRLDELVARDVYEEGLRIPPLKLYDAGKLDTDLVAIVRANCRYPDMVMGDLETMVGSGRLVVDGYLDFVADYGIEAADAVAVAILERSEAAMRRAIAEVPDGIYIGETTADGYLQPTHLKVRIEVAGESMRFDYAGSSPQRMDASVNCVLNVTTAHTLLALKCALLPDLPNNEGLYRSVIVTAPEGSILNPHFPAPVRGRSMTSFNLNAAIYAALAPAIPDKVAAGSGSMWWITVAGTHADGQRFAVHMLPHGGRGALQGMDGPCTMAFPSNGTITPSEIVELRAPVLVTERALRPDSGGAGASRGGLAQTIRLRPLGDQQLRMTVRLDKLRHPAAGLLGGQPGERGRALLNGAPVDLSGPFVLQPGEELTLMTPGGGGLGEPAARDPALVRRDIALGYVTPAAACDAFGHAEAAQ
jgi:N-methylhydantoinase B